MAVPPDGNDAQKEEDRETNKEEGEEKTENKEEEVSSKAGKEEIIEDIMANNAVEAPQKEEEMMFTKAKVIDEVEFSFWNMDKYLHCRYDYVPQTVRKLLEVVLVTMLLMMCPMGLAFLEMGKRAAMNIPLQILRGGAPQGKIAIYLFVKVNMLVTICYVTHVLVSILADNILYVMVTVLGWLNIEPNEYTIEIIQVINSTSWCWKQALIGGILYHVARTLILDSSREGATDYKYIITTTLLIYTLFMAVIFVEKFVMCFMISEIRRKEYRNRIWDINYKTFVFKKLAAISEASPSTRRDVAETMQPEFDPGFYLKYNDLKLNSVDAAETVAESIFGFLEIRVLIYEDIKKFFPENYEEVYVYLSESSKDGDKDHPPVTFEELKNRAVMLYRERTDISRTLQSRDIVINKLDVILLAVAMYLGSILAMILLGIDYKVFLASIGSSVVAFGWIFSDTIKEIYNCFVFLLVNHPYDFGDRVVIGGEELYVSSVDLLSSTFVGVNGRQVFIPTSVLFKEKIHNIRRSGKQSEVVDILLSRTTTFGTVAELRERVVKALGESSKSFSGETSLRGFCADGGNVKVSFAIQHQSNFQDVEKRQNRRTEVIKILENEMKALNLEYQNSFGFRD